MIRLAGGAAALVLAVGVSVAQAGEDAPADEHGVALFMSALDPTRQGFARIINHTARAGEVDIDAYDDDGQWRGPVVLSIGAGETVHFNSDDLEEGNATKGLVGSTGSGQGDWRLVLTSVLDLEVLAYVRTTDGFLTAMHDTVPAGDGLHDVAILNPGSNRDQVSLLRLSNPGSEPAEVAVTGVDDSGHAPGPGVSVSIPAGASRTYTAAELESGAGVGLEGALGDGMGKWRLTLESARQIVATSLLSSPTGHLTNLSTVPDDELDGTHRVSLFPAASDPNGRQGFARVINRSDTEGWVTVRAFDDTDRSYETLTLALGANETRHFNSNDLETGNAEKGLTGSTGAGEGDWRLEITSDLEIDVLSYIRTTDGFLTAMHDTVPPEGTHHRVAVFNPGSNTNQASRLRLVNDGAETADVTVTGIDDAGAPSLDAVSLSVPPGASRTLTAQELEAGSDGFEGRLGDGAGKWQLAVESTQPIAVMSLLSSPTGHLTNLSTAPASDFAPVGADVFRDRFRRGWIVVRHPERRVEFRADGRFAMTDEAGRREGGYTYARTARHRARVVLEFDDGDRCTYQVDFASRLAGRYGYTCDDGASGESVWHAPPPEKRAAPRPFDIDAENGDPIGIAHADGLLYVLDDVDDKVYVYGTTGERREELDFELDADNDEPTGIAHADGRLYVADDGDDKVYAYGTFGDRQAGRDFELDDGNDRPEGVTHGGDGLYVLDDFLDVFAYGLSGERNAHADFEIDRANLFPAGITYADGRFYVVDWVDGKVFAYDASGERDEAREFQLAANNPVATGITHADGRFLVVDSAANRVFVYTGAERIRGPDLVVATLTTADDRLEPEAAFELRAVVRNEGQDPAAGTTLRFYVSDDASIGADDTEVASRGVEGLDGDGSREYTVKVLAPEEPGAYYYGACVETVEGESDAGNNCSTSAEITVTGSATALRRIDLVADNNLPRGIAHSDGVLYVPQSGEDRVYAYTVLGERKADLDFALDPDNDDPERVAQAGGKLYVIDEEDRKVYAYGTTGSRAMGADFDLDSAHLDPDGITYGDGMFYVIEERAYPDKMFVYTAAGDRARDADFDLHDDNGGAVGVAYADGRLYVVDTFDLKVFAYTTGGERAPAFDFELADKHDRPSGMAYANGSFYVPDRGRIFVYTIDGGAGDMADLVVDTRGVDRRVRPGTSLTLHATVRNQGNGGAAATALRYYRSPDATITTDDVEIGAEAVAELPAATSLEHAFVIDAPEAAGVYHFGACVDAVDGERDTANNCSEALRVEVHERGGADLVVEQLAGGPEVWARHRFTLSATVRNRGDAGATATTLRYYRSSDATVTAGDVEVGMATVEEVAAEASSDHRARILAPARPGTYYYGACVDAARGESDSGNNCSAALAVTVTARVEGCAFDLDEENGRPAGVVHANGRLYVANGGFDRRVFAYAVSGERDADSDFELAEDNRNPHRVAAGGGLLYVVDDRDDKVYAYTTSGEREADADFDLSAGGDDGIAYGNGVLYLADRSREKVVAYTTSGDHDADADFELEPYNSRPDGIARAGGRFFVLDDEDAKVYAYASSGEREADFDFDLHPVNAYPEGIAYAGGRFLVVDAERKQVFAYPQRAGALGAQPCFWEGGATTREVPENTPGGVNVGDPVTATGGDALDYTLGGEDAGSFDIVAGTGQLRTRTGVVYDYETRSRYHVTVGVSDDTGTRDTIEVTIHILNLVPFCGSDAAFDLATVSGDRRLSVTWEPLPKPEDGYARVLGYETEIRADGGNWHGRRTFIGRGIGGTVYADLDNGTAYEVRVRAINAEGECGWSDAVPGAPTASLAPRDDREHRDRFGPYPIGSTERHYRLLAPGRCRHTLDGRSFYGDCAYERTAPDAGRIFLEFDDPSLASCEITLAYASLTAGSFVDECFDAGVNTEVRFDRSFRMPEETPAGDPAGAVPRAPRTQEEFDVFAWGREDLVPGLGFGCPPSLESCEFGSGRAYTVGRDPETGLPHWTLGEYSYENTGPSRGAIQFRSGGESFEIVLDFESAGIRATISATGGTATGWPGMPHVDLTLGAQSVLLPIPPSWSAAISVESDFAPRDTNELWELIGSTSNPCARDVQPPMCALLGADWVDRAFGEPDATADLVHEHHYRRLGRNRGQVTVRWDLRYGSELDLFEYQRELLGSTWVFDLTFTSRDTADYVLTITKPGQAPVVVEGFVDFVGDGSADFTGGGIVLDAFPEEAEVPDEAPQAEGEDIAGVEVAAAVSATGIGLNDLQTMVVSASGTEYQPGDWFEPKDGGNQRMMIVTAGDAAGGAAAPLRSATRPQWSDMGKHRGVAPSALYGFAPPGTFGQVASALRPSRPTDSELMLVTVVCMQREGDIPKRGARYFSRAKVAAGDVQTCQTDCVLDGGDNMQECVWACE